MSNEDIRWEVYVEKEEFYRYRDDEEVAALLNLARVANMMGFCFQAQLELSKDDTPAASRALTNGTLLTAGLLFEGLSVAQVMGKYFRSRESYREGFAKLMGDERMKRFRSAGLNQMRNEVAFHFNPNIAPAVLKKLDLAEYKFLTGSGPKSGSIYYNLADEVVMNHLIGDSQTPEEELATLRLLLQDLTYVIELYVNSARALIEDVLLSKGWRVRKTPGG